MRGLAGGLTLLVWWLAPTAAAQTLELRVVEERTGRPLAGVVVRLEQNGRAVVMGLSNEAGRLQLRAPSPGQYQVRAGRIGFEAPSPFSLELTSGTVQRQLEMPGQIRQLPALTVSGTTRCDGRPAGGTLAAALWEEVQLALTANRITVEQRLQVVHAVRFQRDLSPQRRPLRERLVSSMVTRDQPFVSPPADQLARHGFVRNQGDSVEYSAPDAALLLADEFVRTHCFEVNTRGEKRDLVGLAFTPVPGTRRSDVEGTLWIDRRSRELRHIDYRYTGVMGPAGLGDPGGEIHFQRLLSGTWIVREWVIRMPRTAERRPRHPGEDPWVITGWLEAGGRASVTPPRSTTSNLVSGVEGEVFDSLHQSPLVSAVIAIDGEPDSARTDSAGRFSLTVAGRGPRLLRVTHALLGIVSDNSTQEITLAPDRPALVTVTVPPVASFARTLCSDSTDASRVLGTVTNPDGTPIVGARVRASWFRAAGDQSQAVAVNRSLTVESGPRGLFALCDLPSGWQTRVELLGEADQVLVTFQLRTSRGEALWVDLRNREPAAESRKPEQLTYCLTARLPARGFRLTE